MAKNKILLLLVSLWIVFADARKPANASVLLIEAEKIQKAEGDKAAVDYLWKNSEKLERPELMFMAKTLVRLRDFKDIIKVSELALSKNSKDYEFLTFQGKAYLETGKDRKVAEKAQEALRAAIEANPKFEPAYLILDDYYDRQDALSRKLKKPQRFLQTRRLLYEDLITQFGQKHHYVSMLCLINTQDGVNDDAMKYCKKAIQLKKDDTRSQLNLAQIYKQTGDSKKASELLKEQATLNKTEDTLETYGRFLEEEKNYSGAYAQFKECATLFPKSEKCLRGIGLNAASIKKWTESHEAFKTLCRKSKKFSSDVRRASLTAKELGALDWEQTFLELSLNCNI